MKRNLLIVLVFVLSPLFRTNSQNLFTDPSFDSGTKDAWVTWGSDANVLQSFDVLDDGTGNYVAKLVVANAVNDINDGTFKQKNTITSLDSSVVYHLSVRAKAENVASGETAQLIFKTQRLKDGSSVGYIALDQYDLTSNWQTYDAYFYKEDSWNELKPYWNFGAVDGDYYFDDFVLEINKDIANGNFESDFARAWYTLKNTGTIEIVDNNVNTGNYAVKATVNTAGASYNLAVGTNLKIFLDENTDYVLSFYAKSENAAGKVKVALDYYDNSGTKIDTKYVNNETTSSYTQYNIDFTTPANTVYVKAKFMFSEVVDVIYLDDAKIEAKSTATAIKPIKEDNSVKVYPNPANDVLYVSGFSKVKNVEVCDLAGSKAIGVNEMAGDKIDVSSLKKGVYLVKVTTDSGTKVVKVIKK